MTSPSDHDLDVRGEIEAVRASKQLLMSFDWFSRLWGLAVVAHVVGNPRVGQVIGTPTILGFVTLGTGLTAVALVVSPDRRWLLRLLSVLVLLTVWFEAPFIGNHWLLAGVLSVAILVALGKSDSWNWFSTAGRGIHLAFYAFAAFAKLNSSFFDPVVSCAVFYANQGLSAAGLPTVGSESLLALMLLWATAAIELSIPLLLFIQRTRNLGIVLGLAFHILISFDLSQHFYDFTAVLIPLFLLWARPALPRPLGQRLSRSQSPALAGLLGFFVGVTVIPLNRITLALLTDAVFVLWIPASIALLAFVIRRIGSASDVSLRPPDAIAALLIGLVVLNGFTPYLELKTATSWNMYSNLYTVDGESNHFFIRATLPLTLAQSDGIEIVETEDEGLGQYVGSGYLLPERTFYDYLADVPDGVEVTVRQAGSTRTVDASDGVALNPILEKFGLLRAFDESLPVRCQPVWLPAR